MSTEKKVSEALLDEYTAALRAALAKCNVPAAQVGVIKEGAEAAATLLAHQTDVLTLANVLKSQGK